MTRYFRNKEEYFRFINKYRDRIDINQQERGLIFEPLFCYSEHIYSTYFQNILKISTTK